MHDALIWLLVIEVLGLITLPLTYSLFRRLPDRGLIFSKLLALLLSSYVLWILGLTHILPNTRYTIIAILAVLALLSYLLMRRRLPEMVAFIRRERVFLLTGELVFLGLYFLWLSVLSFSPAIHHTEQPMDFAFLNSILQSTYFPPEDPWLAGHSISYYYFGHFMMAGLTKLTAIPSSISYNLSIALIPALVGAAAFSLVYNLIRLSGAPTQRVAILFALTAPLFLVLVGNLEGVLEFVYARGWGAEGFWQWVSIKGLEGSQGGDTSFFPREGWWWWRATRVIDTVVDGRSLDYTITEFPFFSYIVANLHGHVSSLPFLIFNLALGLNLFVSRERLGLAWLRRNLWEVIVIALALGSLAFINIVDFPIFAAVFVALVLVKGYGDWGGQVQRALLPSLTLVVPVLVGAVLLYIPFYLTFNGQASAILTVRDVSTRPFFFFLIWGLFLVISGSFLLRQAWSVPGLKGRNPGALSAVLVITLLPFLVWSGIELFVSFLDGGVMEGIRTVAARFGKLLPGLVIVGVALYAMLLRTRHGGERATAFSLLPLALAFYLLVGVELFYLVDIFGNRMNTVFKVYYQAWLLLAIASAYGLYYLYSHPMPSLAGLVSGKPSSMMTPVRALLGLSERSVRYGLVGLVVVLLLASIYYPVGAALDRTRDTGSDNTLDGLAFLQRSNPGEYEAIKWLRDEAPRGRIAEATGGSFTEYGRISSSTGFPTLLGWKGHEHQWRGGRSVKLLDDREELVAQIYRSEDPEQVLHLLDDNDVRYVYVGVRERDKYGKGQFDRFSSFLKPVFRSQDVVIYERLPDGEQEVIERNDGGAG